MKSLKKKYCHMEKCQFCVDGMMEIVDSPFDLKKNREENEYDQEEPCNDFLSLFGIQLKASRRRFKTCTICNGRKFLYVLDDEKKKNKKKKRKR